MRRKKKMTKFNFIRPVAFFDLESTGKSVDYDQIIQIAIIKIDQYGEKQVYKKLVKPTVKITDDAIDIHGITLDMLEKANANPFSTYSQEILNFIDGCDLGGYNILKFDIPMLENEIRRCGLEIDFSSWKIIDVYQIVKKVFSHSLTNVFEILTGGTRELSHEAEADVEDTITVLDMLLKDVIKSDLGNDGLIDFYAKEMSVVDYAGKFHKKDGAYYFNFGSSKDQIIETNPSLLEWMINKDFTRNTKMWAERFLNDMYHNPAEEEAKKNDDGNANINELI